MSATGSTTGWMSGRRSRDTADISIRNRFPSCGQRPRDPHPWGSTSTSAHQAPTALPARGFGQSRIDRGHHDLGLHGVGRAAWWWSSGRRGVAKYREKSISSTAALGSAAWAAGTLGAVGTSGPVGSGRGLGAGFGGLGAGLGGLGGRGGSGIILVVLIAQVRAQGVQGFLGELGA
jgi:hypothetical protein